MKSYLFHTLLGIAKSIHFVISISHNVSCCHVILDMFSNYVHLLLFSYRLVKMINRKNRFILLKCVSCKQEVAFTLELLSQLAHEQKRQDMVRKLLPQKSSRRNQHVSELPLYGVNALNLANEYVLGLYIYANFVQWKRVL